MRSLCHLFLGLGFLGFFTMGCERHQFDDTKILHKGHGDHGDHSHDDGNHDEEGHAEKKKEGGSDADHGEGKPEPKDEKKEKKEEPRDVGL